MGPALQVGHLEARSAPLSLRLPVRCEEESVWVGW